MDKLKMQTPDITDQNIEQIAKLFPNVITETKDDEGNTTKAIDFDLLKQQLSEVLVEDDDERYRLDWPGKKASLLKANTPITKTLRPCREESVNFDTTENLYLEGDNFEVLKILQESYLNKIKMIYIDPPYNTGKDFVYTDKFKISKDEYETEIGAIDEEGGKLFKNTDTNGRFHSDWLSMMYERLIVARDLLKDDGVIFISIDDNEVHNLRKISDEIFGEENFVAEIIWRGGKRNAAKWISTSHEYMLFYGKNLDYISQERVSWKVKKNGLDEIYSQIKKLKVKYGKDYTKISKDLKNWFNTFSESNSIKDNKHYWRVDNRGTYYFSDISRVGGGRYDIVSPLTGNKVKKPSRGWVFGKEEDFWKAYRDGIIVFSPDDKLPSIKRYLHDNETQLLDTVFYKDRRAASLSLRRLLGNKIFDFPKDVEILKYYINAVTNFNTNDIILDFFSGSATTAHAVMQLNSEDGGNRKFIMVQLPEKTDEKSEAYKAGYKTIADIGKERIRRAGKQIKDKLTTEITEKHRKEESDLFTESSVDSVSSVVNKLDIGFRVYKVDSSNMKDVFYHPENLLQTDFTDLISNIKEDRTSEDLLTQVILDLGLELNLPIEKKEILGNTVFVVQHNALVACFDDNINFEIVDEIAKLEPFKVVFKDASFRDDKDRINVENRFKRLSPETRIRVI